jgi:hypothetical protein
VGFLRHIIYNATGTARNPNLQRKLCCIFPSYLLLIMTAPGVQPRSKRARTTHTTPIRPGRGSAPADASTVRRGQHGDSTTADPAASSQSTTPSVTEGTHPLVIANNLHKLPPDQARRDPSRPWFMFDYEDPSPKFKVMPPDFDWQVKGDYIIDAPCDDPNLVDERSRRTVAVSARGYQSVHHNHFT